TPGHKAAGSPIAEVAALLAGEAAIRTPGHKAAGSPIAEVAALLAGEAETAEETRSEEAEETVAAFETRPATPDPEELQPDFRRRLDRVIERMEVEHGHRVNVVEGLRSQTRQNLLYEQGRSRPGPVVTWTRNSNHTVGRAVDVMIDGSYNNPKGYERLAQIAAEEGLRTLGARDPGHIELPRGDRALDARYAAASEAITRETERPRPAMPAMAASRPGGIARVAQVAEVARVADMARVADVARMAEVARVADPFRPAPPPSPTAPAPAAIDAAAGVLAASAGRTGSDASGSNAGGGGQQGQRDALTPSSAEMELLRADPGLVRSFSTPTISETQFTGGTDAVQRAAQILAMKEGAANAPINHLLLRIDNPNGGQDRIRVDLRGTTVETTLNIGNSAEAEHLASKVGELRQSLERHGLEAEAVRIRTHQPPGAERVEAIRAVLTAAELEAGRQPSSGRGGSDSSTPRDPWKEAQEQTRRDPGTPRHRSRKEQPQEERA
ncbi:MAG TPA: hypothetical protein VMN39_06210, partial [Longimicrobiaceae bacterium]|nr:hypothetical protein [Longimicrobiaceae bacterium]